VKETTMTTPDRIVFEATGRRAACGEYVLSPDGTLYDVDSMGDNSIRRTFPAYRRVESACDGKVLEVATAIYAAGRIAGYGSLEDAVADARALIAACREVSDGK